MEYLLFRYSISTFLITPNRYDIRHSSIQIELIYYVSRTIRKKNADIVEW